MDESDNYDIEEVIDTNSYTLVKYFYTVVFKTTVYVFPCVLCLQHNL